MRRSALRPAPVRSQTSAPPATPKSPAPPIDAFVSPVTVWVQGAVRSHGADPRIGRRRTSMARAQIGGDGRSPARLQASTGDRNLCQTWSSDPERRRVSEFRSRETASDPRPPSHRHKDRTCRASAPLRQGRATRAAARGPARRRIEPVGTHRRDNLNRPVGFSDAPEVATDSNRPSTQTAIRIRTRAVPWPDRVARRSPDRSEAATAPPRRRDRTPAPLR